MAHCRYVRCLFGPDPPYIVSILSPVLAPEAPRFYDVSMEHNKHAVRMALVMALGVVTLVVVAIQQFRSAETPPQQAAVLRAYAK